VISKAGDTAGLVATAIHLANVRYDSGARTISAHASVIATTAMRGPIALQMTALNSGIADQVVATNSANGIRGRGAVWIIADSSRSIAPGDSVSTTLQFVLGEWTKAAINPLAVTVRVLAPR
jgi:hypothetical protein